MVRIIITWYDLIIIRYDAMCCDIMMLPIIMILYYVILLIIHLKKSIPVNNLITCKVIFARFRISIVFIYQGE